MAYKKKVWKTGDIMKQEDINNIENGIYEAHQELKNLHNYDDTEIKNIIGSGTLSTLAKDLKGAINEVFQYASNGKTLIAQAISAIMVMYVLMKTEDSYKVVLKDIKF